MKILYLSDSLIPSNAANSVHVMKMCEGFATCGHEVVLSGLQGNAASIGNHYAYYGVQQNFTIKLTRLRPIKGILILHALNNLYHIVCIRPEFVFGRSFLSVALAGLFFRKLLIAFETHDPYSTMSFLQRWCFNRIVKRSRFIVAMSNALEKILNKEMNNDIPIVALHDGATPSILFRNELDGMVLDSTKLNIGYIGSIQRGRGVELVVELSRLLPMYDFHIVGGTQAELYERLDLIHLPENLHCHGFVSPVMASAYRQQCDILLAPYQSQTLIKSGKDTSAYMSPLKIFEYMADRKAIIASDLPVLREVLDAQNSVLVHPEKSVEWKDAITMLSIKENRNKLADQAFLDFQNKYTWKGRAEKILEKI